jgi:hypothetical protein
MCTPVTQQSILVDRMLNALEGFQGGCFASCKSFNATYCCARRLHMCTGLPALHLLATLHRLGLLMNPPSPLLLSMALHHQGRPATTHDPATLHPLNVRAMQMASTPRPSPAVLHFILKDQPTQTACGCASVRTAAQQLSRHLLLPQQMHMQGIHPPAGGAQTCAPVWTPYQRGRPMLTPPLQQVQDLTNLLVYVQQRASLQHQWRLTQQRCTTGGMLGAVGSMPALEGVV